MMESKFLSICLGDRRVFDQTTYSQPIQESCWSAGSCFETNPKSTGDRRAIGPAKTT